MSATVVRRTLRGTPRRWLLTCAATGTVALAASGSSAQSSFRRHLVDLDVAGIPPREFRAVSLDSRPVLVRRWSTQAAWIVTAGTCSRCGTRLQLLEPPAEPTAPALVCPMCVSRYDFDGKRLGESIFPNLETIPYRTVSPAVLRIG
jgi:hypothetical protein